MTCCYTLTTSLFGQPASSCKCTDCFSHPSVSNWEEGLCTAVQVLNSASTGATNQLPKEKKCPFLTVRVRAINEKPDCGLFCLHAQETGQGVCLSGVTLSGQRQVATSAARNERKQQIFLLAAGNSTCKDNVTPSEPNINICW